MPTAQTYRCQVISKLWLTPTVLQLRFAPQKRFAFAPGQFLSVVVPDPRGGRRPLRRIYSFATPYGAAEGYELCIKNMGGPGTKYLCSLNVGDEFKASAPYGDFLYETRPGRNACFVATGTGVAPFKAMALSPEFCAQPPDGAMLVFGARTEDEIIYPSLFETQGFRVVNAISRPGSGYGGFHGRVTDFLRSLPVHWAWHSTDFYLCGNGEMVTEVRHVLRGHGVPDTAVFQEVYFSTSAEPENATSRLASGGRAG